MFTRFNKFVKSTTVVKVAAIGLTAAFLFSTATASTSPQLTKHIDKLEWIKGGEGLYFALSWGDWTQEDADYGMIVKIEAGVELPRHRHTHDYHGMTIQGNWVHSFEKGDDHVLAPGSYTFQAGKENHGDRCEGTVDCLILIHQHGPRDFFLEE